MSTATTATTTTTTVEAPPPAKGKKKLIIIIIAAVAALVLVGGGGATVFVMKKKAADAETAAAAETEGEDAAPVKGKPVAKHDSKVVPVFVPLDPFTVNLADREAERYAQVGITLEIVDSRVGDQIKLLMPVIRNNILMAIADRTAGELMGREGKTKLAQRVRRETARALGAEVEDEEDVTAAGAGEAPKAPAKARKKKTDVPLPVKAVHFSNFIIQ